MLFIVAIFLVKSTISLFKIKKSTNEMPI